MQEQEGTEAETDPRGSPPSFSAVRQQRPSARDAAQRRLRPPSAAAVAVDDARTGADAVVLVLALVQVLCCLTLMHMWELVGAMKPRHDSRRLRSG
jgi:hypothetical protein